jgi:hypothetical protein
MIGPPRAAGRRAKETSKAPLTLSARERYFFAPLAAFSAAFAFWTAAAASFFASAALNSPGERAMSRRKESSESLDR